jgi:hypothetical protein
VTVFHLALCTFVYYERREESMRGQNFIGLAVLLDSSVPEMYRTMFSASNTISYLTKTAIFLYMIIWHTVHSSNYSQPEDM